jgi:tetratricopeptide (TPR) repeat protein
MLYALGRLDEAEASWARALEVDPAYIWPRYYRGVAAVAEGDFARAAEDLDAVAARESLASVGLWRWVAHRRLGRKAPALDASADWPGPIARFLAGEITDGQLQAEAARERLPIDDRRLVSAWFFIGQKRLTEGRRADALAALRQALALRAPRHPERVAAEAELRRLRG